MNGSTSVGALVPRRRRRLFSTCLTGRRMLRSCQEGANDRFDMWWRTHARKAPTTVWTSGGALMPGSMLTPRSTTTPIAGPVLSTGRATVLV